MATLQGAIAYKLSKDAEIKIGIWDKVRKFKNGAHSTGVECPLCGVVYGLVEELSASDDMLEEDIAFLAKGLESVHPDHPPCVIVRDPKGALWRLTGRSGCIPTSSWTVEQKVA